MRRFSLFPVVLVWVFFSACQPLVAPISSHLERETVSSDYLLRSLLKRQADIKNLRSFVQATLEKKDLKQSLRQTIVACGSESLRVDTFSLFGQALWVFIYDGSKTALYDASNNRIYQGAEVWNILDRVVGVVIDFKEIINVFSGNIPRLESHRINRAYLNHEKNLYQLETIGKSGLEQFEVDMDAVTLLPLKWVRIQNGLKDYTVTWSDYKPVDERPFPHHVEIVHSQRQEKIALSYQNPKTNAKLPSDVFDLPGLAKFGMSCRWPEKEPGHREQPRGSVP
ncbi:MAG: hypothetical protein A3K09_08680 [Nitrospinae bacterium RIFCSPLOWO2_12_FULL_47_7]|nr:MAG: hypothetical protein A3K09_08680 [Nitrospinae bacterium RIFCSPLOWO2_12_FULL_47_7]